MRSIGVGHASLGKMCCHLNMPKPMNSKNYDKLSDTLSDAVKIEAERSMMDVVDELRGENETADASVSVDGTWQRKGFTSTLGVVTAISVDKGKVVDCVILSKSSKGCTRMEKVRMWDPDRHTPWKASHQCNLNCKASSPHDGESWGSENVRSFS